MKLNTNNHFVNANKMVTVTLNEEFQLNNHFRDATKMVEITL